MVTAYKGQMASGAGFERRESVLKRICIVDLRFLVWWGIFMGSKDVVEWCLGSG